MLGQAGLARTLAALRQARQSQDELAIVAGVGRGTVQRIERGEATTAQTLRQIARGLATDGAGHIDEARCERYYARLMEAAGFSPRAEPAPRRWRPPVAAVQG